MKKGTFSMTITGIVVMVVGTLAVQFGFSEDCSGQIAEKVPLLIGAVVAWYGRTRVGDITLYGKRIQ